MPSIESLYLLFKIQVSLCVSILLVVLIITSWISNHKKSKEKKIHLLEKTFFALWLYRIDDWEYIIKKDHRNLRLLLPAMSCLDKLIKDPYWDYLKKQLIHFMMHKQLNVLSRSFYWHDRLLAIRTLQQSPDISYLPFIIQCFEEKEATLRYEAVKAALYIGSKEVIKKLLTLMIKAHPQAEYIVRDPLISSDEKTHTVIKQIFLDSSDNSIKLACLKILSLKFGFLSYDELLPMIEGDHIELKWWAIRALENCPGKQTSLIIAKLIQQEKSWMMLSLLIYLIASLHLSMLIPYLETLLYHEHHWIMTAAALAIHSFEKPGSLVLQQHLQKASSQLAQIIPFVLQTKHYSFNKGIRNFFPFNNDPRVILESLER